MAQDTYEEIIPPTKDNKFQELPEGIMDVKDPQGRPFVRALSNTNIEVLDLISEGEIDGLVRGSYTYTVNQAYQIGYSSATFKPYEKDPKTNSIEWLRSIYWNEIPIVSVDNKYNFQNIDVSFTPGLPNGDLINRSVPQTTISRSIGERFRASAIDDKGQPILDSEHVKNYRIFNKECVGIYVNIRVQQLQETKMDWGGDIDFATVEYSVYYRPIYFTPQANANNFILAKQIIIKGKVQTGFIKTDRIDFFTNTQINNDDFLGWEIKLVRTTPESISSLLRNVAYVDSITEIYGTIFTYPNSAIVRSRFNAEYFQSIPDRYFHARLLKVYVPSTYDPIKRTYNDVSVPWNGTFKSEKVWTNNPAWCFYDLLTNKNYGLGNYIYHKYIDKWTLYEISKYCDTMVSDGYGGYEPRFTCDLIINNRDEAYNVINNMASIFRGLVYYGQGLIYTVQDSPKNPLITFTNASVVDGNFNYSSSSKRVRHTVAVIRYNDKRNYYKPGLEYVEDVDGIRKYGIREIQLEAVGCTSRGQAIRFGKWALISENLETETVTFSTGPDLAVYLKPGDVFTVIDNHKKLARYAGRTRKYSFNSQTNKTSIHLDDLVGLENGTSYVLSVITPSYNYDAGFISNMNSNESDEIRKSFIQKVTFIASVSNNTNFEDKTLLIFDGQPFNTADYTFPTNAVWSINEETTSEDYEYTSKFYDVYQDNFRVVNIEEKDGQYNILGLQYNPKKYQEIEDGLSFERYETASLPTQPQVSYAQEVQTSESTRKISLNWMPNNDYFNTHAAIFITTSGEAASILNGNTPQERLVGVFPADSQNFVYEPKETGQFIYSIYGYDIKTNAYSANATSGFFTINEIVPIKDVVVNSLTIVTGDKKDLIYDGINFANKSMVRYFNTDPEFTWQMGYTGETTLANYFYRLTIREPSESGTPNPNIYMEYTNIPVYSDKINHIFSFNDNLTAQGGPFRRYDVVVEAIDAYGRTSAGNNVLALSGYYDENWSNPYGYDTMFVDNGRITGLHLSTHIEEENNNYITRQFIDPSLHINLTFISGDVPQDCEGAYFYFSTGQFSGENITGANLVLSPYKIFESRADYNVNTKSFRVPMYYDGLHINESGFLCISPYDTFDLAIINNYDSNVKTGLPITNIVPIQFSGHTNHLKIGNNATFYTHSDYTNFWKVHAESISGYKVLMNNPTGDVDGIIISSQS